MKEIKHEIIAQGTPKLENMPKEVFNVFCASVLDFMNQKTFTDKTNYCSLTDKEADKFYGL